MTRDRHDPLARQLDALLGRTRRRVLGHGAAGLVGWGGGAVLLAAGLFGGPALPSLSSTWGMALTLAALLGLLVGRGLLGPLRDLAGPEALARRLEARGNHANVLVAAEESLRRPDRWTEDTSVRSELKRRVRVAAACRLQELGPSDVADFPRSRLQMIVAGATLAAALLVAVLAPVEMGRGLERLARPWAVRPAAPTAGLLAVGSERWVVAGATVDLAVLDVAGGPGLAVCEVRRGEGHWQPLDARLERDSPREPGRLWTSRVEDAREDFAWRFRRGSIVSREQRVVVRDHPLLTGLAAVVTPPAYTGGEPRRFERLPAWIEVPGGSRVELAGTAGTPLRAAALVAAGDTLALAVDGTQVTGAVTVARDLAFRIRLEDAWGLVNTAPLAYDIAAAPDQVPAVSLTRPDDDGLLPLEGELSLVVDAADDYGLGELRLLARIGGAVAWSGGALRTATPGAWSRYAAGDGELAARVTALEGHEPPLRARWRVDVEVGALKLAPGSALELVAEAADNRQPGPAGVGRSSALRFQVPSAVEVLDRQDVSQQEKRSELAEAKRRSRELDGDLDRLTRELLKNPVPDWGRQQEMEAALRRQAALQEELARIAAELQKQLENLASSQLTSDAQLQRADEVDQLLRPQGDQALRELMQKLSEAGQNTDPQELGDALREAARAQQDMARRLDAALSMMDRMAREQELESMTALLEQMLRRQQELADQSRELAQQGEPQAGQNGEDPQTTDRRPDGERQGQDDAGRDPQEMAARQEALRQEMQELRERLEETVRQMKERAESGQEQPGDAQARENLEQALAELEQQMQQGGMDQAAQQLAQMDPQTAAQLQQQAMRDMGSLYHVLLQTQQAMQAAMQMNQVTSLRGLAADLLAVSARQESIAEEIPDRLRDVRLRDLTRRQHRLQQAVVAVRDNLSGLMDESPQRIIKLLEKIDGLIDELGMGVRALEDGRGAVAQNHARDSLARTNRTVIDLLTEAQMSMQSQSGGGSSGSDPSQQLQDLAREQARLNGATDELRRMLADRGLSQDARAQMQRLGQQQSEQAGRVRDLEEQERTRPDGNRLLGDLQAMGRDLESIAEDLGGGLVSEETLIRQERILSRMLDARNAARRRDYSNRRESLTAERLFGDPGSGTGEDPAADARRLRLRYQPLEKAPLEYRDLVRRYFAGLDSLRRLDPPSRGGEGGLP